MFKGNNRLCCLKKSSAFRVGMSATRKKKLLCVHIVFHGVEAFLWQHWFSSVVLQK